MRYCEAHNGISALLVDTCDKYDGIWVSSLTESAAKGMPDNELLSPAHRLDTIREIKNVTDKHIMVDWDTGGSVEHFPYWVRQLENAGVSIIMIEDKLFPKKNSLLDGVKQHLEDVDVFCQKIKEGKKAAKDIQIFARLESLIAKRSVEEAIRRAEAYIAAGADGIMVHSKEKEGTEILEVANALREKYPKLPLVAVPTTYTLEEGHPFDYVVDANMLLRASIKAMQKTLDLDDIKDADMVSVKEIFDLVGF
jgi:phosphoenolpyruvate phosphomutase